MARRLGFRNGVDAAGHDDLHAIIQWVPTTPSADFYKRQGSVRPPMPYGFFGDPDKVPECLCINEDRGGFSRESLVTIDDC